MRRTHIPGPAKDAGIGIFAPEELIQAVNEAKYAHSVQNAGEIRCGMERRFSEK